MGEVKVLDQGFVRLDGHMADDLSVVNAARVSFGRRKDYMDASDEGLIRFLMRDRHGTPFEHNSFRFHVKAPIGVAREWFRHRIASYNEVSTRYVQMEPEFYVPQGGAMRTQEGKPGAYEFVALDQVTADAAAQRMLTAYEAAYASYERLLEAGVAKEVARNVLPLGLYTQFYWTTNARSLMNFLALRGHPTALREIRDYADVIEDEFRYRMPITHGAWRDMNRVAP